MDKLLCVSCQHQIYMQAFSYGECKICKKHIVTGHIPCENICIECSIKENRCNQCGKELMGKK